MALFCGAIRIDGWLLFLWQITIIGYLRPIQTYILNIYFLKAHFVNNVFKPAWPHVFHTELNGFKYCDVKTTI